MITEGFVADDFPFREPFLRLLLIMYQETEQVSVTAKVPANVRLNPKIDEDGGGTTLEVELEDVTEVSELGKGVLNVEESADAV